MSKNVRTITQLGSESLKAVLSGEITPEDAGRISAQERLEERF